MKENNMPIEQGQVWKDGNFKDFVVLHTHTDAQGKQWVHYRSNDCPTEYSCWVESFLERFRPYTNKRYG